MYLNSECGQFVNHFGLKCTSGHGVCTAEHKVNYSIPTDASVYLAQTHKKTKREYEEMHCFIASFEMNLNAKNML